MVGARATSLRFQIWRDSWATAPGLVQKLLAASASPSRSRVGSRVAAARRCALCAAWSRPGQPPWPRATGRTCRRMRRPARRATAARRWRRGRPWGRRPASCRTWRGGACAAQRAATASPSSSERAARRRRARAPQRRLSAPRRAQATPQRASALTRRVAAPPRSMESLREQTNAGGSHGACLHALRSPRGAREPRRPQLAAAAPRPQAAQPRCATPPPALTTRRRLRHADVTLSLGSGILKPSLVAGAYRRPMRRARACPARRGAGTARLQRLSADAFGRRLFSSSLCEQRRSSTRRLRRRCSRCWKASCAPRPRTCRRRRKSWCLLSRRCARHSRFVAHARASERHALPAPLQRATLTCAAVWRCADVSEEEGGGAARGQGV